MTVSVDGVRIQKRPRSRGLLWSIIAIEAILSVIVYISFAAHFIWPDTTRAAAGVSSMLSYEGRLTDTSGNPLGGTGTQYCFRFSIYDASSGGTKLWPAGTPSVTLATTTDGVFTALVGQADSLTYNFYDSDTVYLNVEAYSVAASGGTCTGGSYETLSPRQQIAATGYARSSANVYSSLLFTDNTNNRVQIGTGTGGGSPKFLGLDVKNTNDYIGQSCTTSGTVWYNSAISKALVCENGTIQAISNASATSTIAAINTNTDTPATSGTIVFSNSNGVTFGINGNTITASVNAGGANVTLLSYQNRQLGASTQSAPGQNSLWVSPFRIPAGNYVSGSSLQIIQSYTGTFTSAVAATWAETMRWGLYSNDTTNSTQVNSWITGSITMQVWNSGTSSASWAYNGSTSSSAGTNIISQVTGLRIMNITLGSSIPPGLYFFAFAQSTSSAGYSALMRTYGVVMDNPVPVGMGNNFGAATNQSIGYVEAGTYSATTGAMPATIAYSQIKQTNNASPWFKIGAI